ncbi:hypothetical protein ACFQI7_33710 [Paenibacillus allorhizosphaerae]|nr:hypothetical protein [Paenibacillus allorhizosphaerae]
MAAMTVIGSSQGQGTAADKGKYGSEVKTMPKEPVTISKNNLAAVVKA